MENIIEHFEYMGNNKKYVFQIFQDTIPEKNYGYTLNVVQNQDKNNDNWYYFVITKDDNSVEPVYYPIRILRLHKLKGDMKNTLDKYYNYLQNITKPATELSNIDAMELFRFMQCHRRSYVYSDYYIFINSYTFC